jgi:hypothetical protein
MKKNTRTNELSDRLLCRAIGDAIFDISNGIVITQFVREHSLVEDSEGSPKFIMNDSSPEWLLPGEESGYSQGKRALPH